jgi:SAM-dependent methyltransferase
MSASDLNIQGDWNAYPLRDQWPMTPDNVFVFRRLAAAPVEATANGAHGRLLEVAAAEAVHACRLNGMGLAAFAIEPSPTMLAAARERIAEHGATVTLIRAIAETLPFRDGMFDRVLCDSALDHLADPERGIREMARVVNPNGRVVLTFVNYGGLTVRASRLIYRIGRALRLLAPETDKTKLFWDTPVPYEHNFECTLANVGEMCRPYLELDRAYGISLGWMFPGWGPLLERRPRLRKFIERLDRFAHDRPGIADFVVSVWRPRPCTSWPADELRVRRSNPVYRRLVAEEARYWAKADFDAFFGPTNAITAPARNRAYTGDPTRSWLDDVIARGPFRDVAVLGCDGEGSEAAWLRAGASARLTVYELSPGVIAKVRGRLGPLARRVTFVGSDLNFAELPAAAYDCIWSSGVLHFISNLEHLFTQVDRALRPGGMFAFQCYVGETRMQYSAARLARLNAILASVPPRLRRSEVVVAPDPAWELSPFHAVRSQDVVPLARERFELVYEAYAGHAFPLSFVVDLPAIAREEPALFARLEAEEAAAAGDAALPPCAVYAVFRKRAAPASPAAV